jgi:hypothetical protein
MIFPQHKKTTPIQLILRGHFGEYKLDTCATTSFHCIIFFVHLGSLNFMQQIQQQQ